MIKKTAIFVAKGLVIYLALIVLVIDRVLFETVSPRHFFEQQPFIQSSAFALAVSAVISIVVRSKTTVIFVALCLAYSAFFFVFRLQAALFAATFCVLGAVNFFYRNKITEPLLVMLPIIAGAWVFICFIYSPYLVGWVHYITGRRDFGGSIFEGIASAKNQITLTLLTIPVIGMYFLGKHGYVRFYSVLKSLRK